MNHARFAAALLVVLGSSPAHAQDAAKDAFDRALADMEREHYDTACPLLAESFRLDPLPGVMFTLAECEAGWGKLASAVGHYDEFLRMTAALEPAQKAKHKERERVAATRRAALAPKVPHVELLVVAPPPEGLVVAVDGAPLDRESWNTTIPIDPGSHVVSTQVPRGALHEQRFVALRGQTARLQLEAIAAPPLEPTQAPPPPERPRPPSPSPRRIGAYTAAGVGGLGLLVGATFGVLAATKKSTVSDHCAGTVCDDQGFDAARAGKTFAAVSTIGFAVAIVGLGAGLALFFTDPARATAVATW
jgi:hypothetical protein